MTLACGPAAVSAKWTPYAAPRCSGFSSPTSSRDRILNLPGEEFSFTYTFDSPVDQAVSTVVDAAFVGKFFVLFSFLFG